MDINTIRAIKRLQLDNERLLKHELSQGIPWYARGRPTLTTGTPQTFADVTGSVVYWTPTKNGWFDELSLDINPSTTADITNGTAIMSSVSGGTSQLAVGMTITAAGVPGGTTILTIDSTTQITMSANATATTVGVAVTFGIATDINIDLRLDVQNFELSPLLWSTHGAGTSTRATAVSYDRGIPYLGTTQYKLLATLRTSAADTIADTERKRFVGSVYNHVLKRLFTCPAYSNNNASTTYTFNNATYTSINAGTDDFVEFVYPLQDMFVGDMPVFAAVNTTEQLYAGISLNSTTSITQNSSLLQTGATVVGGEMPAQRMDDAPAGYNILRMLASSDGLITIVADHGRRGSAADTYTTYLESLVLQ